MNFRTHVSRFLQWPALLRSRVSARAFVRGATAHERAVDSERRERRAMRTSCASAAEETSAHTRSDEQPVPRVARARGVAPQYMNPAPRIVARPAH